MSKPKEREAEKSSSKSSTRTSAKVPVGKATMTKAASQPLKTQAHASKSAKSSTKLTVAKLPVAKSERAEKVEKADKAPTAHEKHEKAGKSDRHDKSERVHKVEKAEKTAKSGRIEKAEKPERSERSERASERHERVSEKVVVAPLPTKSPFPKDELGKWRVQLLSRRNEISSDIAGLEKDAMEAEDGHTTPNHLAERGSDADLQDVSLGIAGEEKDIIWQIDRALRKIDESQPIPFGFCEYTKEVIPRSRLALIPWTPLSIEGATHMEQKGLQVEDMLVDG